MSYTSLMNIVQLTPTHTKLINRKGCKMSDKLVGCNTDFTFIGCPVCGELIHIKKYQRHIMECFPPINSKNTMQKENP